MNGDFVTHSLFWKLTGAMATTFTFITGYHFKRFKDLENEINHCKDTHLATNEFRIHFDGLREEQRIIRHEVKEMGEKIDRKIDRVFDKMDELKKG